MEKTIRKFTVALFICVQSTEPYCTSGSAAARVCSLSECLHHSILSDVISVFERQHICLSENTASHEG